MTADEPVDGIAPRPTGSVAGVSVQQGVGYQGAAHRDPTRYGVGPMMRVLYSCR